MKLSEVQSCLEAAILQGHDVTFKGISIDSRRIQPGELFIALKGDNFDGHDFIEQAITKGAAAALVSRNNSYNLPTLKVSDTRKALGNFATFWRQQFTLPLIALTGSCGKTTVKEMIRSILTNCGNVLASQGNFNNDIGMPLTLLKLNHEHNFAVIEMGANHPNEINYLTHMAKPQIAFINNIGPAHLEGFGNIEGVARAKFEIFNGLDSKGTALINADDQFADWIEKQLKGKNILRFGIQNKQVDTTAVQILEKEDGNSFLLKTSHGEIEIRLPLLGQHNVLNALAAATATQAVGASLNAIKLGLEQMHAVKGRLVVRQGLKGSRILDDTYNANLSSMTAGLKVLAQSTGERILVMGDMGELGSFTEEHHREIGRLAKKLGIQHLLAYGKFTPLAIKEFGNKGQHFPTQTALGEAVRALLNPQVTILIKGSRSAKMENIVATLLEEHS